MIFRCGVYTGLVGPRAGPRCGGPGGGPRERGRRAGDWTGSAARAAPPLRGGAGAPPGVGPPAPLAGRERRRAVLGVGAAHGQGAPVLGVGAAHGQGAPRAEHLERDELAMLEALEVLARHAAAEELRVGAAGGLLGGALPREAEGLAGRRGPDGRPRVRGALVAQRRRGDESGVSGIETPGRRAVVPETADGGRNLSRTRRRVEVHRRVPRLCRRLSRTLSRRLGRRLRVRHRLRLRLRLGAFHSRRVRNRSGVSRRLENRARSVRGIRLGDASRRRLGVLGVLGVLGGGALGFRRAARRFLVPAALEERLDLSLQRGRGRRAGDDARGLGFDIPGFVFFFVFVSARVVDDVVVDDLSLIHI